jgi:hypothetical protein
MPNPPKPTELKRRLGNPGKRRIPGDLVVLEPAVLPKAPEPTPADQLVEALWGVAGGWLAKSDGLFIIPLLMDGVNRRARLVASLEQTGWSYESTGPLGNRWFSRPEAVELRNLEKQITAWLSLLGLTPTDRARLGVAEVRQRTKLEELAERQAKNRAQAGRRPS